MSIWDWIVLIFTDKFAISWFIGIFFSMGCFILAILRIKRNNDMYDYNESHDSLANNKNDKKTIEDQANVLIGAIILFIICMFMLIFRLIELLKK